MTRFVFKLLPLFGVFGLFLGCASFTGNRDKGRTYTYGLYPKHMRDIENHYKNYGRFNDCKEGETIASIGAGNGWNEVVISCFVDHITWYLEEIDSDRLYEFERVLPHFERIKGSPVNAEFNLVLGTETSTALPEALFDRVLMINVFHEIKNREPMMMDIHGILKPEGELIVMEPMARKPGDRHANCKHLRLVEPDFLKEMENYGYELVKKEVGEKISFLSFYTFKLKS